MLYISIGHSGKDGGAVANYTTEYSECFAIWEELEKQLKRSTIRYQLVPTNLLLTQRIKWVNERATNDDLLIELHMDSAPRGASGCTSYYYTGNETAKQKAGLFIETYSQYASIKSRGAKGDTTTRHGRLGIVRDTVPLAFLIELGFLTNSDDLTHVRTHGAIALQRALFRYYNTDMPVPENTPSDDHKDAWKEAKEIGLTNGDRPKDPATREEVVTFMIRLKTYLTNQP